MTEVGDALKRGNAKAMSKCFDKEITITFFEKTKKYNRTNAIMALQNFFAIHDPKNYEPLHQGKSTNSLFYLGNLSTSRHVMKVYMLFTLKNGMYCLRELRFEK
jgi:hypothetical protein